MNIQNPTSRTLHVFGIGPCTEKKTEKTSFLMFNFYCRIMFEIFKTHQCLELLISKHMVLMNFYDEEGIVNVHLKPGH